MSNCPSHRPHLHLISTYILFSSTWRRNFYSNVNFRLIIEFTRLKMSESDPLSEAAEGLSKINFCGKWNVNAETSNSESADVREESAEKTTRSEKYSVKNLDNGTYQVKFHIPSMFHGMIIGKKGETVKRIRTDTNTSIHIPWHNEAEDVVIRGRTEDDALAAYHMIKNMIDKARSKQSHNRFISIPMTNPEITENFLRFKEEVLKTCKDCDGINEHLFQNPDKLHLTAGVMMLADEEENNFAVDVMSSAKENVLIPLFKGETSSLKVRVRGLEIMNDDPINEVKILFAKIEDSSEGLLQQLMDNMTDHFFNAGLIKRKDDHVKLHMTVLNSRFFMRHAYGDDYRKEKWHVFDASKILELFKDYDFGIAEINEVHLSHIHTTSPEDGYYVASCKINF